MFYFNTRTRVQYYHHNVASMVEGMCHCYDCAAEVRIVSQYLSSRNKCKVSPDQVGEMCREIGKRCSSTSRTSLAVVVGHGQRWFKPKKYDPSAGRIYEVDTDKSHKEKEETEYSRQPRFVSNDDILQTFDQA